jgi:hypothetical protein
MTPYEIRLDLLKMAREMLEMDYQSKREQIKDVWQMNANRALEQNYPIPAHPDLPSFPSETEIINKAKLLNSFVSNGYH